MRAGRVTGLIGLLAALCCLPLWAESEKKELAQVQSRIKSIQENLSLLQVQKDSLLNQLRALERHYGELIKALEQLEGQTRQQRKALLKIREQRDQKRTQLIELNHALEGQIRAAYAMGRQQRLKLLLNQEDPARTSRLLAYFDYLNRARLRRLQMIQEALSELEKAENELSLESKRLSILLARKQEERSKLSATREAREQLLTQLDHELKGKSAQLKQLKEDEQHLQQLIASLQQEMSSAALPVDPTRPFSALRGRLIWPTRGKLAKGFGAKRISGHWDGVLIDAEEGAPVRAVSRGRIAYAEWLRGYGLLTIIDHGEGFMTLYAFNQSLYKEVGDWVEAGEMIARVGKSGGRPEAGLYFAIRQRGKPVNPLNWCRKMRQDGVS